MIKTKLNLRCEDGLWEQFKEKVSKNSTMNQAVIDLIQEKVKVT